MSNALFCIRRSRLRDSTTRKYEFMSFYFVKAAVTWKPFVIVPRDLNFNIRSLYAGALIN